MHTSWDITFNMGLLNIFFIITHVNSLRLSWRNNPQTVPVKPTDLPTWVYIDTYSQTEGSYVFIKTTLFLIVSMTSTMWVDHFNLCRRDGSNSCSANANCWNKNVQQLTDQQYLTLKPITFHITLLMNALFFINRYA